MRMKITDQEMEFYRTKGFVAIEDFLNESELTTWRDVTEDAVAQRLRDRSGWTNQANPDDYYAKVFTQCVRLADTHRGMAQLILDPKLGKLAATLAGVAGILARPGADQAAMRQSDVLASGQSLLVVRFARFNLDLDRAG